MKIKIELIYKILFDLISTEDNEPIDKSLLFNVFNQFITFVSKDKTKILFQQLIEKIIMSKLEITQEVSNYFYEKFNNVFYYNEILDALFDIIKNKKIKKLKMKMNLKIFIL